MFAGALLAIALAAPGLADTHERGIQADGNWHSIGPAPPAVEAAVVSDPATGIMLIGGVGGGILRSTDGGRTFAYSNSGLTSLSILSLLQDKSAPRIIYAGTLTGIHKSVDAGATWQNLAGSSIGAVVMAMDPADHNTVYVGNSPNGGITRTIDGGATWTSLNTGIGSPPVFGLAIDPRNPQVLFIGTAGLGAWRSSNGGATWTHLDLDTSVWAMLVDPDDSNIVYAGSNGSGVYRSVDGGVTFARVGSPLSGVVYALAKAGSRLYAGTANSGASFSDDGGATWINTGAADSQGLVLTVDSRGTVFLGTSFDGALALGNHSGHDDPDDDDDERDSGRHHGRWHQLAWRLLRDCACQNGHAIAVDPGNHRHVVLSTNDGGLLETRNGGRSWQDAGASGMTARGPRGVAFDPVDSRHMYVGGFTGMGLFVSADNGRSWQRRMFGSAAIYTTGVAVDAFDRSVYVNTFSGDGVWKSSDLGATFQRVDRAAGAAPGVFLNIGGRGITVDPHRAGVVFAASRGAASGVWRSMDAGATWNRVATGNVLSVTVDPTDSRVVYASTPAPSVLKSVDGGATFAVVGAGLPAGFQASRTGSLQVGTDNPLELWIGLEGAGIFRSLDGGLNWAPSDDGLGDVNVYGLTMDPDDPQRIYAATAASVFARGGRVLGR